MSDANVAAAITAAIRKMWQNFNEEILNATYALYRPLQERAPKDGVTVHKEIAYGDDERHRLDRFDEFERLGDRAIRGRREVGEDALQILSERGHLLRARGGVRGVGVRHRLHDDGRAAAGDHLMGGLFRNQKDIALHDVMRLAAFDAADALGNLGPTMKQHEYGQRQTQYQLTKIIAQK